jgi:hypothetical protein
MEEARPGKGRARRRAGVVIVRRQVVPMGSPAVTFGNEDDPPLSLLLAPPEISFEPG